MDSNSLLLLKTEVYPLYRKFITSEMSSTVNLNEVQVSILKQYINFLTSIYGGGKVNLKIREEIDLNNFISVFEHMERDVKYISGIVL